MHLDFPDDTATPELAVNIGIGTYQALLTQIHSILRAQVWGLNIGVIDASHGSGLLRTLSDTFQQRQGGFINNAIEHLIAFASRLDHAVAAEYPELVACKGLGFPCSLHYFGYGLFSVLQKIDDSKAHGMGKRPQSGGQFFEHYGVNECVMSFGHMQYIYYHDIAM